MLLMLLLLLLLLTRHDLGLTESGLLRALLEQSLPLATGRVDAVLMNNTLGKRGG